MSNYSYLFKYIIIGDAGVGKSCLMLQFTEKKFNVEHDITIGVEFGARSIVIEGKIVRVQMWDTAGQESYRSITRSYYRGAVVAILVYDITNKESFVSLSNWIEEARTHGRRDITLVLVGNKVDSQEKREVPYEQGSRFAEENDLFFFEASAKEGTNVDSAFFESAKSILKKIQQGDFDLSNERCGIKMGNSTVNGTVLNKGQVKRGNCKC